MANTYTLISSVTVGSGGASSIDFTSIPATYTDLVLKYSLKSTTAEQNTDGLSLKINTSTANFTRRVLYGDGSNPGSLSGSDSYLGFADGNSATNTFGNGELYIPNYAGSNYKSVSADTVTEANQTTAYAFFSALLWSQTSAITGLSLYFTSSKTFAQYSTAYLYGIKNS